ncbi:MAG: RHS repeat-associated core domain-containing protein, partial [Asticcacaulis sp.]
TGARFRYTGQTVIPEAGLYYYKARVYDPMFGRFLQTDPIGSKDDLDLYAYTAGDPVNASDPTGTIGCCMEGEEPTPVPDEPITLVEPVKPIDEPVKPTAPFKDSEQPIKQSPVVVAPGNLAASTPSFLQTVENFVHEFRAILGPDPDSGAPMVKDVITPGGNPIGTVAKGTTPDIRTVDPKQFAAIQQTILYGSNPSGTYANGNGTWYVTVNGETVGVRTSKNNGVTMDFPTIKMKLHQQ